MLCVLFNRCKSKSKVDGEFQSKEKEKTGVGVSKERTVQKEKGTTDGNLARKTVSSVCELEESYQASRGKRRSTQII